MPTYKFQVNGSPEQVDAAEDMPLLWALRDLLGYTGTKYGCGIGQCGACTVHINGVPVRSCLVKAADVVGQEISTIEGLVEDEQLTAVQRVWIERDVAQCGYCQSGQIMSATALLKSNPNPTDEDIDAAMAGNYCRCGTYIRIREAIHSAAMFYNAAAQTKDTEELA